MKRRSFLQLASTAGALASLGELGFLARLPLVSAAEAKLDPKMVRFHPDIEPLVRLLEETPRERVLEEVAARIHRGTSYQQILASLLLAGVRNIQPRPVGFKFHAVLLVNSAHLASLASPDTDRWLPIFWAIDQFKSSQAQDVREGDWTMGAVDESAVPSSHKARQAFIDAMDNWDEAAADAAIVGLARTAGAHEIYELLARYGARDFREIGHKEIYAANSFRALEAIGWQHAEPVLRSLAYAMLDRAGDKENPSKADLSADRPYRHNLEAVSKIQSGWLDGKANPAATSEMLETVRTASPPEASDKAIELLNGGAAPESLFAAFFDAAGELMMRSPGILSLHATTFTNAIHYSWTHCHSEETRKLLLLQNAAFLPLFRGNSKGTNVQIDRLEPLAGKGNDVPGIDEIFDEISRDRLSASRKILAHLKERNDPADFAQAARRLIFLKGTNAHDYKYSSAVLEDYEAMRPPWRDRYLAASAFYLKGSGDHDNQLVQRTRAALA
ncbi:MAG TPA: hypothetical protein VGR78_18945 [Verrucomicrobiae bacterium]|nr:hypothetical protein [Verrucomicrobiae bacterium]